MSGQVVVTAHYKSRRGAYVARRVLNERDASKLLKSGGPGRAEVTLKDDEGRVVGRREIDPARPSDRRGTCWTWWYERAVFAAPSTPDAEPER